MTSKQSQKAGPQSTQTQIYINGIDEKRVREVVSELLPLAIKEFSV